MGTANFQPSWWNKQVDGSAWDRVKAAMQRDWEQTKNDFTPSAPDLHQDVDDTVKMATGNAPIPPPGVVTPRSTSEIKTDIKEANNEIKKDIEARRDAFTAGSSRVPWADIERPVAYGFAARNHYSKQYPSWDVELERELRGEWETGNKDRTWDDVRDHVRTGFNAPAEGTGAQERTKHPPPLAASSVQASLVVPVPAASMSRGRAAKPMNINLNSTASGRIQTLGASPSV